MKITIHETMVPGNDPLIDFPMLFSYTNKLLKSTSNGGYVSFPDGRDIRFTGPDPLTLLEYEFEYYDPVTGTLVAWVRIPFLSATANTEVFLYFGDPKGSPRWNRSEVWSNQYTAVWHMNDDPSAIAPQITDATSSMNHGTTGGTMTLNSLVEGKISGGIDFDGVDDYVTMPVNGFNTDSGTVEMWINLDLLPLITSDFFFAHRQQDPVSDRTCLRVWDTGEWGTGMGNTYDLVRGSILNTAAWHHLAITWNGTEVWGFLDGVKDFGPVSYSALDTVREIFVMTWMPSFESADGTLDELRVSSVPRDSVWIEASYCNQNQPGSFYLVNSLEAYEDPCEATILTINDTCDFSIFTNIGAGISGLPDPGCGAYMGGELWFKVTVPSSGSFVIQTDTEAEQQYPFNNGWMYQLAMALYEGTCNNLTLIGCYENNSIYHPRMAGASLSDRTPGEDIWVRVWENTNNDNGKFKICVTRQSIEPYDLFGGGAYCQGDTGVSITLSGSEVGIDYTLILNDTIRLDTIQGDGGPVTWSPVQPEGIYRIMGEDPGSGYMVLMNNSTEVEILPLPQLSFDIASITCFEDNDGSISTTVTGGAEPYQLLWSGPGGYTSAQEDLVDLSPGIYVLTVRDSNQCHIESSALTITEPDLLVASLDQITHLTAYEANDGAIEIEITGGTQPYTLSWTGTDDYVSIESNASGMTVGYYSVWVTDDHLCMDSILMIMVSVEENAEEVFIPEGFSPNGDGFNDHFVILGLENFPENELMVFNRQGVELFHQVNYENDWDGRPESGNITGGILPEGTYYYIFKFGDLNIRKGTIYLNRE
ncbi:MAG: DUF2341 domain-containing protein [Bacteroidales bacterium]|nr:DUF2341 domain-containing protein [Bacteroidales bacterium]